MREYPKVESATVSVRTVYVGASADLVRVFITTPLERTIAAAGDIDYIESQSVLGLSTINVRLKLNFNANEALADISSRVASSWVCRLAPPITPQNYTSPTPSSATGETERIRIYRERQFLIGVLTTACWLGRNRPFNRLGRGRDGPCLAAQAAPPYRSQRAT